jgi:hypothetical protein
MNHLTDGNDREIQIGQGLSGSDRHDPSLARSCDAGIITGKSQQACHDQVTSGRDVFQAVEALAVSLADAAQCGGSAGNCDIALHRHRRNSNPCGKRTAAVAKPPADRTEFWTDGLLHE